MALKKMFARAGIVAVIGTALLHAVRAQAAPHEGRPADAVYSEARGALDRGDYAKACPLFREYYELDPTPAALFTMAECEARWGKNIDAVTHFEAFLRRSDAEPSPLQEQRTRLAYEQVAKLQTLVARVSPVLGPDAQGQTEIKIDGAVIQRAEFPFVVAPGDHVLTVTTSEGRREVPFRIAAGEVRKIELSPPTQHVLPAPQPPPAAAPPRPEEGRRSERLGAPVLVAGGVGAAATLTGIVFGALAWTDKADISRHCVLGSCDHEGKMAADRGQAFAAVSTIGFVVGALGLATAATLYFVGKSGGRAALPTVLRHVSSF